MVSLLSRNGTCGFLNARALTTFPTLKAGFSWTYSRGSAESQNNIQVLAIINNSTHWSSMLNSPYRKSSPPKVVKGVHFKHLTHLLRLFKLFLWGRAVGLSMLQNLFADWRSQTSLWDSPHSPILKNVNSCSNGAWYGSQHRALQSKWPNANKLLLMEVVSRKPWKSRETRLLVTSHQESSLFKLGLIKSMFVFLL